MHVFDLTRDYNHDFNPSKPRKKSWDADRDSLRLRADHAVLWTKSLRSGVEFAPVAPPKRGDGYLLWTDPSGRRQGYASDTITQSYGRWLPKKSAALHAAKAALTQTERERYLGQPYTAASTMIWPGWIRRDGLSRQTMNTARTHVGDRIDLTLECVRLHFCGTTPAALGKVIETYADFFALFESFDEFVEFFHFDDLVTDDRQRVRSLLTPGTAVGADDFRRTSVPTSRGEYVAFREATLEFIAARGQRMATWVSTHRQDVLVEPLTSAASR